MKVWLIHQYAIPPDKPGITRHYDLMHELQRRGHETLIIAGHKNHRNPGESPLPGGKMAALDSSHEVPFLWLRSSNDSKRAIPRVWNMLFFFWRLITRSGLNLLDGKSTRPDIIIGCTPDPFTALGALSLSRHYNIPFVLHLGDIWPMTLVEIGGISRYHPFVIVLSLIEKYLYKKADLIISPLSNAKERIKELGINTDKAAWIPSSVDISAIKYKPPSKLKGPLKIYYTGRFGPANHVDLLLTAIAETSQKYPQHQFEFHFIGDGPELPALKKRARASQMSNVYFTAALPKSELLQQLSEADAFMLTLGDHVVYRYGIGLNKLTEYMAAGRPIILATPLDPSPIETKNAGIYTVPAQPGDIAAAFTKLSRLSYAERSKVGKAAREYVTKSHNLGPVGEVFEHELSKAIVLFRETNYRSSNGHQLRPLEKHK